MKYHVHSSQDQEGKIGGAVILLTIEEHPHTETKQSPSSGQALVQPRLDGLLNVLGKQKTQDRI